PCSHLHGHNYVLTVVLKDADLDDVGFVQDYRELDEIKKYVDNVLDHKFLNDLFDFNTTVENMCKFIFDLFKPKYPLLYSVQMSETPKTTCEYTPYESIPNFSIEKPF
ncbi:MAG: 6-carboxytetrahydropterin synthase, partial [Acinetobacter sp.]|nr:6-carboxytetrahydropterin synthase [Acinetobacter sp.]